MFKIYRTKRYEELFEKMLSKEEKRKASNLEERQLKFSPYVGDALSYPFFREKRIGGKRIYYLIYSELKVVVLVDISSKKNQQETIDKIKALFNEYESTLKNKLSNAPNSAMPDIL